MSSISIGGDKLAIPVAFSDGVFDIATVYDGHVLGMSETRCYDIVAAGECVKARVERLKLGCLNEDERAEIRMRSWNDSGRWQRIWRHSGSSIRLR